MNVHRGESWADMLRAITETTLDVKRRVSPDAPFGLGLRLGYTAASALAAGDSLSAFLDLLAFGVPELARQRQQAERDAVDVFHPTWIKVRPTDTMAPILKEIEL